MSGLAALFYRHDRPVDAVDVWSMLQAAPYRGPDGMSIRIEGSVGLGHAKMAVTPEEEAEAQPLISGRTGCAIIADLRLDNRDELRALLPERPSAATSDADLVLRAYEEWGVDAFPRLLGDFAVIIFDPRSRRLVCARDTSGQRVLFYRCARETFAAASEMHQLFQDPAFPMVPNEARIRDSLVPLNLASNAKDPHETFFAGVFCYPAGHVLVVDRQHSGFRRYWELQPPSELRYRTDDEYAEHYLALFKTAVAARLRTNRPMGALLSGGMDSSSVVCTAQELDRAGIARLPDFMAFSMVFGGLDCDESPYIQAIRAKYELSMELIDASRYLGHEPLESDGFLESPSVSSRAGRDVFGRAASQRGVRAVLTGDVADNCVLGTRLVFDSLLRQGRLRTLARHMRAYRRVSDESLQRIVTLGWIAPLLPLELQKRVMLATVERDFQRHRDRMLPSWIARSLASDLADRQLELRLDQERRRRFSSPVRETEFRLLYPPEAFRHPAPWPIEVWRPFSDRRLHEFLLAIPPEQKFEPAADTDEYYAGAKRLARRAMRGILPEAVRRRTSKTVFNGAIHEELRRNWLAYESMFGPAARPRIVERGYVDRQLFWARLLQFRDGDPAPDQVFLRHCVALETWLRSLELPPAGRGDGSATGRRSRDAG